MAYAARAFKQRAVVVVPEGANAAKAAAIRDLGADLRVTGSNLAEASEHAARIAREEHLRYVEDGEDPDLMIGCATLALEVVEQLPDFDRLIVPVGGGNLLAACALVLGAVRPDARITGVQSAAAPAVYESWKAGRPIHLGPESCATFAGGLATSYPGHFTFQFIKDGTSEMTLVKEEELIEAALVTVAETGHLPEGAGAAAVAALLAESNSSAGGKVVLLLTGGNFESVIWDRLASAPVRLAPSERP
jgi:threonine dehydratase